MLIRLAQIHDDPFAWQETLSFAVAELMRPEVVGLSPVECRGRLSRLETGFFLRLDLRYLQTLACNRCMADYDEPVEERLELLVQPGAPGPVDGERELEEEELGLLQLAGEVLDTAPLVAEQVQLDVPMKPLCREGCKGLCSGCGADLNRGPCGCRGEEIDPRWAALAALRERHEN